MKVKYWLLIIVVLFGVVFFAPSVLCMNSLCKFFSFNQDTGAVGDTIGGTTALIVGLISIFLLIWTLIEQKKSNDKQIRFMQDERFENTLFNFLNEQREITSSLYIDFHGLAKNDVTKEIHNFYNEGLILIVLWLCFKFANVLFALILVDKVML